MEYLRYIIQYLLYVFLNNFEWAPFRVLKDNHGDQPSPTENCFSVKQSNFVHPIFFISSLSKL